MPCHYQKIHPIVWNSRCRIDYNHIVPSAGVCRIHNMGFGCSGSYNQVVRRNSSLALSHIHSCQRNCNKLLQQSRHWLSQHSRKWFFSFGGIVFVRRKSIACLSVMEISFEDKIYQIDFQFQFLNGDFPWDVFIFC